MESTTHRGRSIGTSRLLELAGRRLAVGAVILIVFLAGYVAGQARSSISPSAIPQSDSSQPVADQIPAENGLLGDRVEGFDPAGLPRYPGAIIVEFRQVARDGLLETEVEYVVDAGFDEVHRYYRQIFDRESWSVADLGIYQGEWTFFVIKDGREALVEIEARGSGLIEIEIELTEPVMEPAGNTFLNRRQATSNR